MSALSAKQANLIRDRSTSSTSHLTSFNQLRVLNSALRSFALAYIVNDIGPELHQCGCQS